MKPLPVLAVDLVDELDKLYPESCPSPDWPERKIWIEVGHREVVRHLLARKELSDEQQ